MGKSGGVGRFDPTSMKFPTDSITLGQMRAHEPNLFNSAALDKLRATGCDAIATHRLELRLAEQAVALAVGSSTQRPNDDRRDLVEMLNRAYKVYGVSSGIQQTWQLVRDFEAEAVRQAHMRVGKSR